MHHLKSEYKSWLYEQMTKTDNQTQKIACRRSFLVKIHTILEQGYTGNKKC